MGIFSWLKGRKKETAPPEPAPAFLEYQTCALQGIGSRESQEDAFFLLNDRDVLKIREEGLFAAVADGMGGMADGRAAIYEESGIQGDVYLESQQGDTEYFGTLYNENLVSSEKDSTQLELYPVNYMTLRKAAQVPIYLS